MGYVTTRTGEWVDDDSLDMQGLNGLSELQTDNTALISSTTGTLTDPSTGESVYPIMASTIALPAPTPAALCTVAAAVNQSTGVIGTMASTKTAADALVKQLKLTLPAGTRAVTVDYTAPSGLACGPMWMTVEPLEDQLSASRLAVGGSEAFRILPGQKISFGVEAGDADLTRIYLAAEYAGGTGYTDASVYVQCWEQSIADQVTLRWLGQVKNTLVSDHLYVPFAAAGASSGYIKRYSNNATLAADLAIVGTENYSTNIPGLTLDGSTYYKDVSSAMALFASLAANDQMLILLDFKFATNPSSHYVFSMGSATATGDIYGGYGLQLPGAGSAKFKWQPNGDANADLGNVPIQTTGSRYYGAFLVDCRNDVVRSANAGVEAAPLDMTFPSNTALNRYPLVKAATGCSFGARSQSSGAGSIMPENSILYRMLMLKSRNDISADFAAIAAAAARYPNDLPDIIRGL